MTTEQIRIWLAAAEQHKAALASMGANSRCAPPCPCSGAREAYAAAVDGDDEAFALASRIEALYPEVLVEA